MVPCELWVNAYLCNYKLEEPVIIALNPINTLMAENEITKTRSIATTFIIPAEEAKPYVRFGYGPLTIFNRTQGKFQGK